MAEAGQAKGLIVGFDAGQTHTSCRLADAASGQVLGEGASHGVSHLAAEGGSQRFSGALRGSLEAALSKLTPPSHGGNPAHWPLLAAGIGASGRRARLPEPWWRWGPHASC